MNKNKNIPKPPEEMVAYYKNLDEFVSNQTKNLKLVTINKVEGIEEFLKKIGKESSLLEEGYVPMDSEQVAKNFNKLVELLEASTPENQLANSIKKLIDEDVFNQKFWDKPIEEVEESVIKLAEEKELDVHSLLRLSYWAMSPYWRAVASDNKEKITDLPVNSRPTCPVCGQFADFAVLDEDKHGKRYLICIQCDVKWPYKRMGCSYCGNDDYDKLGYIVLEDVEGYKIYHCEECKTYLKTFDQRADVPRLSNNQLMENVETLFLDLLAAEKGYSPMK
ncbi:formate dehydrogenase accessory protein FdhE [Desulfuribacillus alkaliarsenatis]|uniref:FdhE central domain-containing protein n=1 Tax=Desulfuribacillus alkaliarsenatis TaxID=766136 RepID=A0A1E5FZM1_9FIRM|nr:formate dehydrogenase accessory protein FdhE [Desulfuribacillus alkaliarsenatis]OEF95942.1 hypothetical protein BHF68_11165 [Desulfuribacillus alkaliarsenatis]